MTGEQLTYNERSRLEVEIEDVVMKWCEKEKIHALNFKVSVNKIGDCIGAMVIA